VHIAFMSDEEGAQSDDDYQDIQACRLPHCAHKHTTATGLNEGGTESAADIYDCRV
jgi:hypothetical protein